MEKLENSIKDKKHIKKHMMHKVPKNSLQFSTLHQVYLYQKKKLGLLSIRKNQNLAFNKNHKWH